MKTIEEGKIYLKDNWKEGVPCPCCNQFVKLYLRSLNSAMSYALILIYNHFKYNDNWLHVENYLKSKNIPSSIRGDFSKLRYWGLLEIKEGEREDGSKRVGYYRITDKGRKFVDGKILVQEKVKLYNQKFLGFTGKEVTIKNTLGKKFDYRELMGFYFVDRTVEVEPFYKPKKQDWRAKKKEEKRDILEEAGQTKLI